MKVSEYVLDAETAAVAETWFWKGIRDLNDGDVYAKRLDSDDVFYTFIAVFKDRHAKSERGTMWVDWKLFWSHGHTAGETEPLFGDCAEMVALKGVKIGADEGYLTAEGFCKWDGCREFQINQEHTCSDEMTVAVFSAVMTTMTMASRKAGYEGDK